MKNSKHQVPSFKKASSSKPQDAQGQVRYPAHSVSSEDLMLKDEPPQDAPQKNGAPRHPFDFEERTARFGEAIVKFAKRIPFNPRNDRIISQLVGAGTSIGANYDEASEAVSKKDFRFSMSRCKKEAKETKHFLRMAVASEPHLAEEARPLYREAHELLCICSSMHRK